MLNKNIHDRTILTREKNTKNGCFSVVSLFKGMAATFLPRKRASATARVARSFPFWSAFFFLMAHGCFGMFFPETGGGKRKHQVTLRFTSRTSLAF